MDFETYLAERRGQVDAALDRLLPQPSGPAGRLLEAMRYALLAGGKRLRPILALATSEACGGAPEAIIAPACALEMIHTYSLIHDDLPAMDDDDLRRGRPTVHRAFGEAEAILAGDALLTLAFEVLAERPEGNGAAGQRAAAVAVVARRAGVAGMVGGQIADLEAEREPLGAEHLAWIHARKTGDLFAASAEVGAIHAGASPVQRAAFARFGEQLGLAFQIADDLLDRRGTATELGKTPGKDERAGKATYPAMLGIEGAERRAAEVVAAAEESLESHNLATPALRAMARFATARTR